jgi:ABC-2 type transport system ATP-binding protein
VRINGVSVEDEPEITKQFIGYLPENNPLYDELSAEEYLSFAAGARLIPKRERKGAIDRALAACGLEEYRNQRIGTLSKGFRQRAGLAQAILHDPEILILDEPTSGLDPNQIVEIRSLIRELGKRKTVILSTHILQEVEAVCSGVLILNEGRIAAQGSPDEIARNMRAAEAWELYIKAGNAADMESSLASLGGKIAEIKTETLGNGTVKLSFVIPADDSGENADGEFIFDWAVSQNYKITGMSRKKTSLEALFMELTRKPGALSEKKSDVR